MKKDIINYSISLAFENVSLPPFQDILILSHKCPHGMNGLSKCMQILSPDRFEVFNIDVGNVEAIIVSNQVLSRMPIEKIIELLSEKVFPFITEGEVVRVDFHIKVSLEEFQVTLKRASS